MIKDFYNLTILLYRQLKTAKETLSKLQVLIGRLTDESPESKVLNNEARALMMTLTAKFDEVQKRVLKVHDLLKDNKDSI